jgi:hypothetical protein
MARTMKIRCAEFRLRNSRGAIKQRFVGQEPFDSRGRSVRTTFRCVLFDSYVLLSSQPDRIRRPARGGRWFTKEKYVRDSYRYDFPAVHRRPDMSLRCVRRT